MTMTLQGRAIQRQAGPGMRARHRRRGPSGAQRSDRTSRNNSELVWAGRAWRRNHAALVSEHGCNAARDRTEVPVPGRAYLGVAGIPRRRLDT
jgi:hypothetical protein